MNEKNFFPTYSVLEKSVYQLIVAISVELPTYKWWRGNCENSPLPTIGSAFQCVKVDLPFSIDICTCAYILKWYLAHFLFCWKKLIYLLSRTEATAQCYLWLNRHPVVKGIQIASPPFICILKVVATCMYYVPLYSVTTLNALCSYWATFSLLFERPSILLKRGGLWKSKGRLPRHAVTFIFRNSCSYCIMNTNIFFLKTISSHPRHFFSNN